MFKDQVPITYLCRQHGLDSTSLYKACSTLDNLRVLVQSGKVVQQGLESDAILADLIKAVEGAQRGSWTKLHPIAAKARKHLEG